MLRAIDIALGQANDFGDFLSDQSAEPTAVARPQHHTPCPPVGSRESLFHLLSNNN